VANSALDRLAHHAHHLMIEGGDDFDTLNWPLSIL
jgi:hypothetical protein